MLKENRSLVTNEPASVRRSTAQREITYFYGRYRIEWRSGSTTAARLAVVPVVGLPVSATDVRNDAVIGFALTTLAAQITETASSLCNSVLIGGNEQRWNRHAADRRL